MAQDFFIKLDGIDGQSEDKNHDKWIEVQTFKYGSEQNITSARSSDVSGRGTFVPFSFTHLVDNAHPKIQKFCMSGQKQSKVLFHVCRAIAGTQIPVIEITMENVKIVKAVVEVIKTSEGAEEPVETVELLCGKMTWKVTPIKSDNTKGGAVEDNFDQIKNA